jgi:hypothetical protein
MLGIGTSAEPNQAVRWSTAPCALRPAVWSPLANVWPLHTTSQFGQASQLPSPGPRGEAKFYGKHFARHMNRAAFLPIVTVTSEVLYPSPSDKRED